MLPARSVPVPDRGSRRRALRRSAAIALACAACVAQAATYAPGGATADHASAQAAGTPPAAQRIEVTGKVTRSPVLGARALDGSMGGTIPSAAHGWQPDADDAEDMYVYVPGVGWELGDTRAERTQ